MDPAWLLAIVAVVVVAAAVGANLSGFISERQRTQAVAEMALRKGWSFETGSDPRNLLDSNLPLFKIGDDRGVENTVWGEWRGLPVTVADYWYRLESSGAGSLSNRELERFSVAVTDVPAYLPHLTIEQENLASWMAERVGIGDIDFESGEFNDRFRVHCESRKFAYEFIDARMMRWLISTDRRYNFQTRGTKIVLYARRLDADDLIGLMGTMKELYDRVPPLVWAEYGTGDNGEATAR